MLLKTVDTLFSNICFVTGGEFCVRVYVREHKQFYSMKKYSFELALDAFDVSRNGVIWYPFGL